MGGSGDDDHIAPCVDLCVNTLGNLFQMAVTLAKQLFGQIDIGECQAGMM